MNKERFIAQLTNPKIIGVKEISDWEDITKKHPYFQAAKSIYLKSLKQNNNFKYNKVLKETAAMTTDRTVLFEYITDIRPIQKRAVSEKSSKSDSTYASKTSKLEAALEIGTPLEFDHKEVHSFNEWLQLSKVTPIRRKEAGNSSHKLNEKIHLIDQFIQKNPSIPPVDKTSNPLKKEPVTLQDKNLMTETLAKVYLEQKKYSSAIHAYQILILKYPEKSGFFADQIKKIKFLKANKL
tara:strand:+ start:33466 stop:34179 length:714 start_codon:yes stop_codon:yes gene_type:complete